LIAVIGHWSHAMPLPQVPDPLVQPLGDEPTLLSLIAGITGEPAATVATRFQKEQRLLGANVAEEIRQRGITPNVWTDRLIEFYAQTHSFLYESLVWNQTLLKNQVRKWIADFLHADFGRPAKVLVFGDGLGFESLYFAQAGHDVTYFEVSTDCVQFARANFQSAGAQVQVLQRPDRFESESFDVVVCLDVLEHVPDPPAVVAQLAAALRSGGRMIVHAPFYFVDRVVSTHLRSNMTYSGDLSRLYTPHGLHLIDGRLLWDPIVLEKVAANSRPNCRRPWRRLVVRAFGLLLAVGRFWALPHIWIAKAMSRSNRNWPSRRA
jgi:SAM-dependent methyltransferase